MPVTDDNHSMAGSSDGSHTVAGSESQGAAPSSGSDWSTMELTNLHGTEVEWCTITAETRKMGQKTKQCLFCGHKHKGGPSHIRTHLDGNLKPRHVSAAPC